MPSETARIRACQMCFQAIETLRTCPRAFRECRCSYRSNAAEQPDEAQKVSLGSSMVCEMHSCNGGCACAIRSATCGARQRTFLTLFCGPALCSRARLSTWQRVRARIARHSGVQTEISCHKKFAKNVPCLAIHVCREPAKRFQAFRSRWEAGRFSVRHARVPFYVRTTQVTYKHPVIRGNRRNSDDFCVDIVVLDNIDGYTGLYNAKTLRLTRRSRVLPARGATVRGGCEARTRSHVAYNSYTMARLGGIGVSRVPKSGARANQCTRRNAHRGAAPKLAPSLLLTCLWLCNEVPRARRRIQARAVVLEVEKMRDVSVVRLVVHDVVSRHA